MSNTEFASVPAVKQYLNTAQACGLDLLPYLEQAAIDPALLEDNSGRIPGSALERLLALLIPASVDPFFGLHTAQYVQHNLYSVLGYISMNCVNLDEVFRQMPLYEEIVGQMGSSSFRKTSTEACIGFNCNFTDPLVRRHVTENVLASWDRFAKSYLQLAREPLRVYLEHSPPEDAPLDIYRETFHCEVLFDQEFSGTWMNEGDLYDPIEQANPQMLETLLAHASQQLRELDSGRSLREKIKNMLRLMIAEKLPSSERLAEELEMSSRTLHRKLKQEGTHYQEVLDELRQEMAIHYLTYSDLSPDDMAAKLGFVEARSFYRSFKQWTGKTVGEYRRDL